MECSCSMGFCRAVMVVQPAMLQVLEERLYLVSDAQLLPGYVDFLQRTIERLAHLSHAVSKHLQSYNRKEQSLNAFLHHVARQVCSIASFLFIDQKQGSACAQGAEDFLE